MNFDQELATQNKMRTQVLEQINTEDGRVIHVYREKIIKMAKPVAIKTIKAKTIRTARVTGQPSKKDLAVKLYQANLGIPRANLIELFMEALQMSKAGATTYAYNVTKV